LAKIIATRQPPLRWHAAPSFCISKGNDKVGAEGERVVVALCPIGRSVYKVALDAPIVITDEGGKVAPEKVKCELKGRDDVQFRIDTCDVAFHQFGCVPKCRREEAITTQKIHSFMLREANCCETTTFFDGKNVCYSMDQDHLAKVAAPPLTATSFEHDLVKQRIAYAVIHTGTQYLSVHQGVLPGDHAGPRLFLIEA